MKMMTGAMYQKYASSQNYFYTRDINNILTNTRNNFTLKYYDYQTLDEEEEYLKRQYKSKESNQKLINLTEYYKYHIEIPRIFIVP